jgi:hypothetical protein
LTVCADWRIQVVVATPDYGGCGDEEEWPSGGAEGVACAVLGGCPVGVGS